MNKCKCGKSLGRNTKGELCKTCYNNRNQANGNSQDISTQSLPVSSQSLDNVGILNEDDYENAIKDLGIDMYKSLSELTVRDLILIAREQYSPLNRTMAAVNDNLRKLEVKITRINEANRENATKVDQANDEIKWLKKVVLNQQKYMEGLKRKEASTNIIVSGIPNDVLNIGDDVNITDDEGKIGTIFDHICCADKLMNKHKTIRIPSAPGKNTYYIKLCFEDTMTVKHILDKAKLLKEFEAARIYINYDEPYYSRRENNRLRKKKATLLGLHNGDDIKIQKGKLYHNNIMVDQFDLANQIF